MQELVSFAIPSIDKVAPFMGTLERIRSMLSQEEWRGLTKGSPILRSWRFFLSSDPYTRWGLIKPRGYPGDATLMDFAYGHASVQAHIDAACDIGKRIYSYTSAAKQSESARQRIQLIREQIEAQARSRGGLVIASFAAGHARELENLSAEAASRVQRFIALDVDASSLAIAAASAQAVPFTPVRMNVIKDGMPAVEPADFVYSLGLFDYLTQEHAQLVLGRMWSLVRPGGRLLIANLAPEAANLGYCESIMDWWMITRDQAAMTDLGEHVSDHSERLARIEVVRHGCFNYLVMDRIDR